MTDNLPTQKPAMHLSERGVKPQSIEEVMRVANAWVQSGMAVKDDTPQRVCIKVMTGMDLGLPVMMALTEVVVIKNRPTLSAKAQMALIQNSGLLLDHTIRFDGEGPARVCSVSTFRDGQPRPHTDSFAMSEAIAAGLTGKDVWRAYADDMLFARALSRHARRHWADVTMGMYAPEDMQGPVAGQTTHPTPRNESVESKTAVHDTLLAQESAAGPPDPLIKHLGLDGAGTAASSPQPPAPPASPGAEREAHDAGPARGAAGDNAETAAERKRQVDELKRDLAAERERQVDASPAVLEKLNDPPIGPDEVSRPRDVIDPTQEPPSTPMDKTKFGVGNLNDPDPPRTLDTSTTQLDAPDPPPHPTHDELVAEGEAAAQDAMAEWAKPPPAGDDPSMMKPEP